MRTTSRLAGIAAALVGLTSLLLLSAAASPDDSLARIANYRQWSKVSQVRPQDLQAVQIKLAEIPIDSETFA